MRQCLSDSNNAKSDAENKAAARSNAYYKVIICVLCTVFVTLGHFRNQWYWNFIAKCKNNRFQCCCCIILPN